LNFRNFFAELKRRKLYSVAVAYVVAGWALAQGAAQVFPVFDIPSWVVPLIVLLIVLGFPVALVLSWFFDLTRYGIVRTPDLDGRNIKIVQSGPDSSRADAAEKLIAVLPFDNQNRDPDTDYLSDGIPEASAAEVVTKKVIAAVFRKFKCSKELHRIMRPMKARRKFRNRPTTDPRAESRLGQQLRLGQAL
jgi:hypothetical protein